MDTSTLLALFSIAQNMVILILTNYLDFCFKISLFSKKVTDLSFMLEVDGNLETMQNCWTTPSPIHGSKVIIYLQVTNSSMSWLVVGLKWTGHMSFFTGQDQTPKFAKQVLPDRTDSGVYLPSMVYKFS